MVKLFVGGLTGSSVTDSDLRSVFEQEGPVIETVVMSKGGFGFVHMESKEDALKAINSLNGTELHGAKLSVELSKPRKGEIEDVKLFIGNVEKDKISNRDLEAAFSKYGTVTEAAVVEKFAFVHMNSKDDAKVAIKCLHRSDLNGCVIDVKLSSGENRRGGGRDNRGGGGGRDDRRGFGDRGRDPYYDDYYYERRERSYDRRPPPPRDPYYRDRYDSRDDAYGRRPLPPPPPRGRTGDPYYDNYYAPPPRSDVDPYRYSSRDTYPPFESPSFDRDILPPRSGYVDDGASSRSRYLPPPRREDPYARRDADPYGRREDDPYVRRDANAAPSPYAAAPPPRSDYDRDGQFRAPSSGMQPPPESFAEDSYSAASRSALNVSSSSLYTPMSAEFPGERRPAPSSVASDSYSYGAGGGGPPPAKRAYASSNAQYPY